MLLNKGCFQRKICRKELKTSCRIMRNGEMLLSSSCTVIPAALNLRLFYWRRNEDSVSDRSCCSSLHFSKHLLFSTPPLRVVFYNRLFSFQSLHLLFPK